MQSKIQDRVRTTYLPASRVRAKYGQDGGTHDNVFTSDISNLSNFLLRYVESKLGLGMATEQTERK